MRFRCVNIDLIRTFRVIPCLTFAALLLMSSTGGVARADTLPSLEEVAGWKVPGFEAVTVSDLETGADYARGKVQVGDLSADLLVFRVQGQSNAEVIVTFDSVTFSDLVPALKGSPLDNVSLSRASFLFVPSGNDAQGVSLPAPASETLGVNTLDLQQGLSLRAVASLSGGAQKLLAAAGSSGTGLPLLGTVDPSLFQGSAGGGVGTDALINSLDLAIPIPETRPAWQPGFFSFTNSVAHIQGRGGKIAMAVSLDATVVIANQSITFKDSSLSFDDSTGKITISSSKVAAGDLFSLAAIGASLDGLALRGEIDGATAALSMGAQLTLDGHPEDVTIRLSEDGGSVAYEIDIGGTIPVARLAGWDIPGLSDLEVGGLSFGSEGQYGTLEIGGIAAKIAVFRGPGQQKPNIALGFGTLNLSDLVPAAKGTPLDQMSVADSMLVAAPKENEGKTTLSPKTKSHLGIRETPALDLREGVNLAGSVELLGELKELVSLLGVQPAGLPIHGGMDYSVFSGKAMGSQLAAEFINNLDLSIPLGTIRPPGMPAFVNVDEASVRVKGKEGAVVGFVASDVRLEVSGHSYTFDSSFGTDMVAGNRVVVIDGDFVGVIEKPLGIPWLTLRKVSLHASLGKETDVSMSGWTDIGTIKDLEATAFINTEDGHIIDAGLELTGADIPLTAIPAIGSIPGGDQFSFRDLIVSERSIGGTVKSKLPVFDGLTAVLFESGGNWSLVLLRKDFSLADAVPLPDAVKEVFAGIKLDKAAFVISEGKIDSPLNDLPLAARKVLLDIYGDPGRRVRLPDGLSLVAAPNAASMSKQLAALNVSGNLVLEGGLEGIFSGEAPAFDIAAVIPPVKLPLALSFIKMPVDFESSFFLRLGESKASVGVELTTFVDIQMKNDLVQFHTDIDFQLDTEGGVTIQVDAVNDKDWPNPLGANGFKLDAGTKVAFAISATSEIKGTIVGNMTIRDRVIKLGGSLVLIDGTPAEFAAEGAISEIGTDDLVHFVSAIVTAGGNPAPQMDFPPMKLTNVDFAFATPGTVGQEFGLDEGGVRLEGDVWFLVSDAPLGKLSKGQITDRGIVLQAELADFQVGPVAMSNNKLDVSAQAGIPPVPPYFRVNGKAMILGKSVEGLIDLSLNQTEVSADLDLGELLNFDFRASQGTPELGVSASTLQQYDLGLHTSLRSDLPGWLRNEGKTYVNGVFDTIGSGLKDTEQALTAAQQAVDTLNGKIASAREDVRRDQAKVTVGVQEAQDKVTALTKQIDDLSGAISGAQGKIRKCDYTKNVCILRDIFHNNKCIKTASAPDIARNLSCGEENVKNAAIVESSKALREGARLAKDKAQKLLDDLKAGVSSPDVVDLDPRVATLLVEKEAADMALAEAMHAAQGIEAAADQLRAGLDVFSRSDAFVLRNALINGSLKRVEAGQPVVAGIDFVLLGEEYHMGFAFSMTDLAFTTEQLQSLALFMAVKAVQLGVESGAASPAMLQLLHDAYEEKHAAAEAKLDQALRDNGLFTTEDAN